MKIHHCSLYIGSSLLFLLFILFYYAFVVVEAYRSKFCIIVRLEELVDGDDFVPFRKSCIICKLSIFVSCAW